MAVQVSKHELRPAYSLAALMSSVVISIPESICFIAASAVHMPQKIVILGSASLLHMLHSVLARLALIQLGCQVCCYGADMTSCAGVYDWYAAYSLGQVAVRLESVLDSSKRPLYAVHGMQDNALSFHKSLNIACANTGAAQWTALCTGLHPQVLQAVDALRAAALPPGNSFNMFAVSRMAKHWRLPRTQYTAVGSTQVLGMSHNNLPAFKAYFNAIKGYADALVRLRDAQSMHDYGGAGPPSG